MNHSRGTEDTGKCIYAKMRHDRRRTLPVLDMQIITTVPIIALWAIVLTPGVLQQLAEGVAKAVHVYDLRLMIVESSISPEYLIDTQESKIILLHRRI